MIGRTLDRYKIEAKLGEGGMGVVYNGLHLSARGVFQRCSFVY